MPSDNRGQIDGPLDGSGDSLDHLPAWASHRCADCGEPFYPGFGTVWSNKRPGVHTHGGLSRCRAQAASPSTTQEGLAAQLALMQQAIVEARESLGRLVSECDEENWNEEVAGTVFSAMHSLDRGYDAYKLVGFTAAEVVADA